MSHCAVAILGLRDIIYQNEPDLTYYCSLCNRFVSLLLLKDHKTYHNALSLLEFHYPPSSLKSLLNRRTAILKRLKVKAYYLVYILYIILYSI